jgi:hypothetical protein
MAFFIFLFTLVMSTISNPPRPFVSNTISKKALLSLLSLYRSSPLEFEKHQWLDVFENVLKSNNCAILLAGIL